MWGIIPAAGVGSRIQPLAFSKELLPVGSRFEGDVERPRAVSEYLIERMVQGGVDKICFIISPGKSDILSYYGGSVYGASVCYAVQQHPAGLCDAIFRALPMIGEHEPVVIGLPDTVWFPDDALKSLDDETLSFLLFPVQHPERFDAVVCDDEGAVLEIQVKQPNAYSYWIWGAFKMPGHTLHALHRLWQERGCADEYMGTLVNAYLASGGRAKGVRAGTAYVDVGTIGGYREALRVLTDQPVMDATLLGQSPSGVRQTDIPQPRGNQDVYRR